MTLPLPVLSELSDRALIDAYEAIDAEPGEDPRKEALLDEIKRRDLDTSLYRAGAPDPHVTGP